MSTFKGEKIYLPRQLLLNYLNNLLTNYRPLYLDEIGTLFEYLAPEKEPDSGTSILLEKPPLSISSVAYAADKEFWDIVAHHQDRIEQIVRAHSTYVVNSLVFVTKFPVLNDLDLKSDIFKTYFLKTDFHARIVLNIDRENLIMDSLRAINSHSIQQLQEQNHG